MKRLLLILLLPVLLMDCKKKSPEPDANIAAIVGKWRLDAYEQTVNGQKQWIKVDSTGNPNYLSFRFDGVILDSKGLQSCCAPGSFIFNGTPFKITPKADVPVNPTCAFVDCVGCESWTIEQTGNEMIISLCIDTFPRSRYVRV